MSNYEILTSIIAGVSATIAVIAIIISKKATKKANEIAETQSKTSQGQIELQINQMISQTQRDVVDSSLRLNPDKPEFKELAFNVAVELNLNAYDEACSKYIDNKIDKERFKRNYYTSIGKLIENPNTKAKIEPMDSPYRCIKQVYEEWYNLEKPRT